MKPKRAYLRRPKKVVMLLVGGSTGMAILRLYKPLLYSNIKIAAEVKKEKNEQITFHHQAC